MRILGSIYYCYYLFYTKGNDIEPEWTAKFALSAVEACYIIAIVEILFAYLFCRELPIYIVFSIIAVVYAINHFIYLTPSKEKQIIKAKLLLYNNKTFTIIFSLLFFSVSISSLFWLRGCIYYIISRCKG